MHVVSPRAVLYHLQCTIESPEESTELLILYAWVWPGIFQKNEVKEQQKSKQKFRRDNWKANIKLAELKPNHFHN
jgi:hypothetical protein